MWVRKTLLLGLGAYLMFAQSCSSGDSGGGEDSSRTLAARFGVMVPDKAIPVPAFDLQDLQGRRVRLADFRGKIVFLTFSTTW